MSHLSVYKTEIKGITKEFLVQAITALAKKEGLQVVQQLSSYASGAKIDIGLKGKGLPNGIGFSVDEKGCMEVKGDSWMQNQEYNRIQALSSNWMKAYKAATNARLQHPAAKVNMAVKNKEVQLEVCW